MSKLEIWNDLEWLFHAKLGFRTRSFRLRGFGFQR